MNDTYPITTIPAKPEPVPLDLERIRTSMKALKRTGQGFVIPVEDLKDAAGAFKSRPLGQRVHRLAEEVGIRVSTKKIEAGLRVRREK